VPLRHMDQGITNGLREEGSHSPGRRHGESPWAGEARELLLNRSEKFLRRLLLRSVSFRMLSAGQLCHLLTA